MPQEVTDPQHANASSNQLPAELVQRLFARISEVSSLPDIALRIIELANDPDVEVNDLLEAVRSDPALAMRLMRTVNSSYYALNDKVADLKQAMTLLGLKEVRNLALTTYVAQMFREKSGYGPYERQGLWRHMLSTAMIARLIARTCRKVPPEEAYLAGLLHDLGLILIDQYVHRPFCRVIDSLTDETPLCEVERRILGFDHARLGEFVAAKWGMPPHLSTAIGHHHAPEAYDGCYQDMIHVASLADFFCCFKGLTPLGVGMVQEPPLRLFGQLDMSADHVKLLLAELDDALAAAEMMAVEQVR